MQTRRKCEQCNTLNDEKQIYCANCGKYLRGKVTKKDNKLTIWGIDESPAKDYGTLGKEQNTNPGSAKMIVVCPECSTKSNADNGVLPLSCSACGYFFQAGIDKIISEADLKDNKKTVKGFSVPAKVSSTVNTDTARAQGGPLKRVTKDTTSLRITSITSNTFLPELMKEAGNIIGKNGTVFRSFVSNKQISIWHTATGWYARATIGTPLYNGVPMNQGVQVKLSAGDLLVIDQKQFMIELF